MRRACFIHGRGSVSGQVCLQVSKGRYIILRVKADQFRSPASPQYTRYIAYVVIRMEVQCFDRCCPEIKRMILLENSVSRKLFTIRSVSAGCTLMAVTCQIFNILPNIICIHRYASFWLRGKEFHYLAWAFGLDVKKCSSTPI